MKRGLLLATFALFALIVCSISFFEVSATSTGDKTKDARSTSSNLSTAPQTLPFTQDWSNTGLITANDDWSGVPGIEGYLGQDITVATGTDPQTLLTTSALTLDLDDIANQAAPNTLTNGGVAEFDGIPNPVVALQGSGTADAPYLIFYLDTTGKSNITVAYNLRDVDGSADNSIQPVALQYRVGNTGNFTNVAAGFVADASSGPSTATLVTPVSAVLGADANNQPLVQVRVMTTNAVGSDEWIGVDDINITGNSSAAAQHVLDFNGDGKTDYSVARNTGGGPGGQLTWFNCFNGVAEPGCDQFAAWGLQGDEFVPADYDGDHKTDIAVWRPGAQGYFYILQSLTNTVRADNFGISGDDPSVVADYTGDGLADPAVYRAGASAGDQSFWYYRASSGGFSGSIVYEPWGQNGDFPGPGDYDGDGKADFMVQRNAGGGQAIFWLRANASGLVTNYIFGTPTDVITPGDYDGDGKTDIATIRGSGGNIVWFYRSSITGNLVWVGAFGSSATDFPVPGDYDGDGKTDQAVWRAAAAADANYFYVNGSTSGYKFFEWGQNGDYPTANFNTH